MGAPPPWSRAVAGEAVRSGVARGLSRRIESRKNRSRNSGRPRANGAKGSRVEARSGDMGRSGCSDRGRSVRPLRHATIVRRQAGSAGQKDKSRAVVARNPEGRCAEPTVHRPRPRRPVRGRRGCGHRLRRLRGRRRRCRRPRRSRGPEWPALPAHWRRATGWLATVRISLSSHAVDGHQGHADRPPDVADDRSGPTAPTRVAAGSTTPMVEFSTGIRAQSQSPDVTASIASAKVSKGTCSSQGRSSTQASWLKAPGAPWKAVRPPRSSSSGWPMLSSGHAGFDCLRRPDFSRSATRKASSSA